MTDTTEQNYVITVIQRPGESEDDVQRRIAQWRAGEDVEDVTSQPTNGDELIVVIRNFGDGAKVA